MKICDLHTHSVFSDGTFTPTELISAAKKAGICAIALTDHNTINGLCEFEKAGTEQGVIAVKGVEFSTEYKGTECHIVALFVDNQYFSEIEAMMTEQHKKKRESNRFLIQSLADAGFEISYEDVRQLSLSENFNRAHIGHYLCKTGQVESIEKAFSTVLSDSCGYYIPTKKLDTIEIIEYINKINAFSVWAHPFESIKEDDALVESFVQVFSLHGLKAIETNYVLYDAETEIKAKALAEKYSLLRSGGSDFHGERKPKISLGIGLGDLCVPFEYYEKIKSSIKKSDCQ